eukprot:2154238-Rhodomonas_salina.2
MVQSMYRKARDFIGRQVARYSHRSANSDSEFRFRCHEPHAPVLKLKLLGTLPPRKVTLSRGSSPSGCCTSGLGALLWLQGAVRRHIYGTVTKRCMKSLPPKKRAIKLTGNLKDWTRITFDVNLCPRPAVPLPQGLSRKWGDTPGGALCSTVSPYPRESETQNKAGTCAFTSTPPQLAPFAPQAPPSHFLLCGRAFQPTASWPTAQTHRDTDTQTRTPPIPQRADSRSTCVQRGCHWDTSPPLTRPHRSRRWLLPGVAPQAHDIRRSEAVATLPSQQSASPCSSNGAASSAHAQHRL